MKSVCTVFGVFLVRIFPHSDRICSDTEFSGPYFPAFGLGKCGPEDFRIRTLFTQCKANGRDLSDFMQSLDTGVFNKDHILLIQSFISGSLMSSRGTERKTGQGARNIH